MCFVAGRVLVVLGLMFGLTTGIIGPSLDVLATLTEYYDLGVLLRLNSRVVVSLMPCELIEKLLTWPDAFLLSMSVVIEGMKTDPDVLLWFIFIPACLCNEVGTMSFELAKTSRFGH